MWTNKNPSLNSGETEMGQMLGMFSFGIVQPVSWKPRDYSSRHISNFSLYIYTFMKVIALIWLKESFRIKC